MDSYKVFQSICLALVLSLACADGKNEPCTLEKGYGEVRLAGGASNKGEGRAEVRCDVEWGTISDDHWNEDLSEAFCIELGFNGGVKQVQVMNVTIKSNGPVFEIHCTGEDVPIGKCTFTKREPDHEETFYFGPGMDNYTSPFWNHTNDVMLKCFQPDRADLSKSSVQQVKGQSNLGQDSQDAVVIKETRSNNIILLVVLDGIEFVLLLVAVVVTSFIVYRKATREMKAALKDKRTPESQAMLDISQVTVQPTAPVEDPQEGQQWKSSGETVRHNPVYGMAEKY